MLAQQKHHDLWYGTAVTRGGVSLAVQTAAVWARTGQGKECEGGQRLRVLGRRSRERACTRSEALRYARAIGISTRIIIGGHWLATVITLSFDRSATASCIVA